MAAWHYFIIGGRITPATRDKLGELVAELDERDGSPEDVLEDALSDRVRCHLAGNCNGGAADRIEEFLREHNLLYVVQWGECDNGNFHPGCAHWVPGMERTEIYHADRDGDPVLSLYALKRARDEGKSLDDLIQEMTRFTADAVPPLELVTPEELADDAA